jgi:beta-glucanase (GH16 family)
MVKISSLLQGVAASVMLAGSSVMAVTVREDFTTFDTNTWRCQVTCPVIEGEKARFRLRSGVEAGASGSFTKARYTPKRFTSGRFTTFFSLTERPIDQAVWWGVALWDEQADDEVNGFNEINFGYTTDQSLPNTTFRFESAKRGNADFRLVDVGFNIYDESYHTATLEWEPDRVAFYFDGVLKAEITDTRYIPDEPMDLILGPRLVPGSEPLTKGFTESIDWVEIEY